MSNSRKPRFLALASRQGHTRTLQPLSSPPRLPCRSPGSVLSVASLSRPEPHLSRVCKLTRAHNYPHTHITDHRRRRHALPLHTCSNTAPPKHSPAQSSHGPPFGSRGSPTAAAPLGSFQCVSCTSPRLRCSRELERPPRRVLKPEPRIPCSWVREPAGHPVTAAGWATSAPCTPLPSGVGEIQAQRPAPAGTNDTSDGRGSAAAQADGGRGPHRSAAPAKGTWRRHRRSANRAPRRWQVKQRRGATMGTLRKRR